MAVDAKEAESGFGERNGSVSEQAFEEITTRILSLEMPPLAEVTAVDLAHDIGVSRTPVQEALSRLLWLQLVTAKPRGYVVAPLTVGDLHAAFQIRLNLESLAVDLAVKSASQEDLEFLLDAASGRHPMPDVSGLSENRRFHVLAKEHDRFHLTLAHISGNRRLEFTVRSLLIQTHRGAVLLALRSRGKTYPKTDPPDQVQIAELMLARKTLAAVEAMENHIEKAFKAIAAVMVPGNLVRHKAAKRKLLPRP